MSVCRRPALLSLLAACCLATLAAGCSGRGVAPDLTPAPTVPLPTLAQTRPPSTATPGVSSPTVSPTPRATSTATPDPLPGGQVFEYGDRSSNLVALTFDMGGRVDPALDIMDWLVSHRVRATIFMTGATAASPNTDAGREVLRIVEEHLELFVLGNHSYSHPDFRDLDFATIEDELARTEAAIAEVIDVSARPYFRPPFGGVDDDVVAAVAAAGYDRTVMRDIYTIDWRPPEEGGPTAADIVSKVTTNALGGSIILMHLGGYSTFEALPAMVAGLRARGLEPATLAEVLP